MTTIHHGQTEEGKRFTVVGIYDATIPQVKFGVALCGPRDHFSRKIGRSIAEGRATHAPTLIKKLKIQLPEDKDGKKELIKMGFEVADNVANDPYLYQEIFTTHNKEVKEKRMQIYLEQLNKQISK